MRFSSRGIGILMLESPEATCQSWLVIGSPPAVIFLALIGGLVTYLKLIERRVIQIQILVIGLTLLFPLATLIALRPTLYDGTRQFLFLAVPLSTKSV